MRITDWEGGWLFGPKTFSEITGRKKLWAGENRALDWIGICKNRRPCPLCGESSDPCLLFVAPGGNYERCHVCGMVYTGHVPTEADLENFYQSAPEPQEWAAKIQDNKIEKMLDRRKFWWALERTGWYNCHGGRLLDVGCSTGTLLEVAGDMNPAAEVRVGVELNDVARAKAEEVADQVYPSLEALEGYFNVVTLWEVLEHVIDPAKMLAKLTEFVRHGSTLVVCVPNINSLAARMLHEKAPMFGPGHLNMYSPDTLRSAILTALPGAKITMTSIISWSKEIRNWMNLTGPFDADDPRDLGEEFDPETICKNNLEGYKLVAWARV